MRRRVFVIGDIEMGKGDIMDDFHDDDVVVRFVEHAASVPDDVVVLVLNGDIFDFLKMDYEGKYPRSITEDISLWKMREVLKAHPAVFTAWKKFLDRPGAHLVFVIGNHDADVVWPGVQKLILESLHATAKERSSRVVFTHAYDEEHFHVQHGNLIDPVFGFNHQKAIITHKGKRILNLPLGSQISTQYLVHFKAKHHDKEVLYPQHEVFKKYPEYKKDINRLLKKHGFKIFLLDPLLRLGDPMYRVPFGRLFRHFLRHGFDGVHDDRFLDIDALDTKFGKKQLYVLSHAHVLRDRHHKGARYIFVDCWRSELNIQTPDLQKKPKTYVEICLEDSMMVRAELKVFGV